MITLSITTVLCGVALAVFVITAPFLVVYIYDRWLGQDKSEWP